MDKLFKFKQLSVVKRFLTDKHKNSAAQRDLNCGTTWCNYQSNKHYFPKCSRMPDTATFAD